MAKLILPSPDLKRMIRHRQRCGGDRYDEVWNGVYVMAPIANNEHMGLVGQLYIAFSGGLANRPGVVILPGCNVSDQPVDWTKNYRVPDVAVFLPGNTAEDRETYWLGGPDLAVEVLSPGDRARKKLGFYARVGVREVLLVDRKPWSLELYRLEDNTLILAGRLEPGAPGALESRVLGLTLRLLTAEPRPTIELRRDDGTTWLA